MPHKEVEAEAESLLLLLLRLLAQFCDNDAPRGQITHKRRRQQRRQLLLHLIIIGRRDDSTGLPKVAITHRAYREIVDDAPKWSHDDDGDSPRREGKGCEGGTGSRV